MRFIASPRRRPTRIKARSAAKNVTSVEVFAAAAEAWALGELSVAIVTQATKSPTRVRESPIDRCRGGATVASSGGETFSWRPMRVLGGSGSWNTKGRPCSEHRPPDHMRHTAFPLISQTSTKRKN